MSTPWEAPSDIKQLVKEIRDNHHPEIAQASIWCLITDANGIHDNRVRSTITRKCTKTENLSTGHHFKIFVYAETWAKLTDAQRRIAIDEALCRCGVKYIPETIEVNGKRETLKDDLGRVIFTNEMAFDQDGTPKWKINKPDAEIYFAMLKRHVMYSEEVENTQRVLEGKPLKGPIAANRADVIDDFAA